MKKIIGMVLFVVALFAALTALLTAGTTSGERRWDFADMFARIVGALKPSSIMLAITAIIPAILLSTATVRTDESHHDSATSHGTSRDLWLFTIIAFVLGLLTLFRSTFGGGGKQQHGEHVDPDEHAGEDVTATPPATEAVAQPA